MNCDDGFYEKDVDSHIVCVALVGCECVVLSLCNTG